MLQYILYLILSCGKPDLFKNFRFLNLPRRGC